MTRDDYIRRVKALRALGRSPGPEGLSARRKASDLMAAHRITEADLRQPQQMRPVVGRARTYRTTSRPRPSGSSLYDAIFEQFERLREEDE